MGEIATLEKWASLSTTMPADQRTRRDVVEGTAHKAAA